MQICTFTQTHNHASIPPLGFYRPDALPATQPTASKHLTNNNNNKSSPKSFGKSRIAFPHGREWTHLLHVLANGYAMPTAGESSRLATGTLLPLHTDT